MNILSIETIDKAGSVAALDGIRLLAELRLNAAQRSAQSLAPAIHRLLEQVGWNARDVRLVAVAVGPGSFTGLRVGVTTAKTFAYAVGADLLGVQTLEVIAAQTPADAVSADAVSTDAAPAECRRLSTVIDAQRGQVYVGEFARGIKGRWDQIGETRIVDDDAWLAGLTAATAVSGPGLRKLAGRLPPTVQVVPEEHWDPRAGAVGRLALEHWTAGQRDDLWQLVPLYFRKSAAEEKWEAAGK